MYALISHERAFRHSERRPRAGLRAVLSSELRTCTLEPRQQRPRAPMTYSIYSSLPGGPESIPIPVIQGCPVLFDHLDKGT